MYYLPNDVIVKSPMISIDSWLSGENSNRGGVDLTKLYNDQEIVFAGFRVIGGEIDMLRTTSDPDRFTHDLPKCDMKFTADRFDDKDVQNVLHEMKKYLGGAALNLYQTTNSFHVYGARILDLDHIESWLQFLRKLDAKHGGVIDTKWLNHNRIEQPLRITQNKDRGFPRLFSVI
jgi:hypothetical protein